VIFSLEFFFGRTLFFYSLFCDKVDEELEELGIDEMQVYDSKSNLILIKIKNKAF